MPGATTVIATRVSARRSRMREAAEAASLAWSARAVTGGRAVDTRPVSPVTPVTSVTPRRWTTAATKSRVYGSTSHPAPLPHDAEHGRPHDPPVVSTAMADDKNPDGPEYGWLYSGKDGSPPPPPPPSDGDPEATRMMSRPTDDDAEHTQMMGAGPGGPDQGGDQPQDQPSNQGPPPAGQAAVVRRHVRRAATSPVRTKARASRLPPTRTSLLRASPRRGRHPSHQPRRRSHALPAAAASGGSAASSRCCWCGCSSSSWFPSGPGRTSTRSTRSPTARVPRTPAVRRTCWSGPTAAKDLTKEQRGDLGTGQRRRQPHRHDPAAAHPRRRRPQPAAVDPPRLLRRRSRATA